MAAGHWRVAPVLLPALVGAVSCASGSTAAPGEAVYGRPTAEQFQAATEATQQAGTARFVSTLTFTTATAKVVHRTVGSQDYAARTSRAAVSLRLPRDFPESAAKLLGEPGKAVERTLVTAGDDVYFRRDASSWLRYTPAAFNELGDSTNDLAVHAAGDAAPYGGTLADLVPRTIPREEPKREADGSRVYRVTALPEMAAELLPENLPNGPGEEGSDPVELSVRLDAEGRLNEVTADLGPLLKSLHKDKILLGVTHLNASYSLSAFGEPVQHDKPGKGVEDAEKALAPLGTLKGGQCAAFDTGLPTREVARPVDCQEKHDIKVFAQVSVDRTFPGQKWSADGDRYARQQCRQAFDKAPEHWMRGNRHQGKFAFTGSASVSVSHGAGVTTTSLTGDYTCFIVTS